MTTSKINILTFIFFSLITLIITWPLALNLTTVVIDPYDALLINWIINWSINHPFSLNTNIFYPFQTTLAYSDFHLSSVLTAAPFVLFFKEPLLAANINLLLGFILTAFSTFLLTKLLTKDTKIALLAGTLFSFGAIHVGYASHLQLFAFWPFIFTLYFFFRKNWTIFIILFFLSVASMPLFFFFFMAFFVIYHKNLKPVLIAFLVSSIIFIPYLVVSRQFNYVRPITDAIHFSLTFQQFFKSSGLITILLIPIVIFYALKRNTKFSKVFLLLTVVSFILALGPGLHIFEDTVHVGPIPIIPLPYAIFYYFLPGFSGFRTPSRWLLLAFFAFVILFALVFKHKLSKKIVFLLIVIILLQVPFKPNYSYVGSRASFPPEVVWLSKNYPGAPIIQFPIYGWFDGKKIGVETLRMHYSLIHSHPMFNGYSGFSPKSWEKDVEWLQKDFPNDQTITYLKSLGIKLILTPEVLKLKEVKLIKKFPNTNIYAL